jgi:hypothetical protein
MNDELPHGLEAILAKPETEWTAEEWQEIARYAVAEMAAARKLAEQFGVLNKDLVALLQRALRQRDALHAGITHLASQVTLVIDAQAPARRRAAKRAAKGNKRSTGRPKVWTEERLLHLVATFEAAQAGFARTEGSAALSATDIFRRTLRRELSGKAMVEGQSVGTYIETQSHLLRERLRAGKALAERIQAELNSTLSPRRQVPEALRTPAKLVDLLKPRQR